MSWVATFLTPIIKGIVFVALIIWVGWLIYWVLSKTFKNFVFFLKYKVFGRKYDEKVVEWCVKADELGYPVEKVKSLFLLKGHNEKKVKEIVYIYTQIRKLRGGLAHDEKRIRESNLKKLPKI